MFEEVHVELREARGAEGMTAVDHNPWDVLTCIVILLAEEAFLLVEELVDELIYLFAIEIGWVLRLLEEEGRGVFKLFHFNSKII